MVRARNFVTAGVLLVVLVAAAAAGPATAREHVLLGAAGQAVGAMIDELRQGDAGDIMPYVTALEFILVTAGEGLAVEDAAIRDDAASIVPGVFVRLSEALANHEELWKTDDARHAEVSAAAVFLGETAVPVVGQALADPAATVQLAGVTAAGEVLRLLQLVEAGGESAESVAQAMGEALEPVAADGEEQLTEDELRDQKDAYEAKLHDFLNEPMGGFYSSDIRDFEHYHSNEAFREYVDHLFALGYGIEQAEGYYYLYVGEPVNYKDGEMD